MTTLFFLGIIFIIYALICIWATNNYKRSIYQELIDERAKRTSQAILYEDTIARLKDDFECAMVELTELRSKQRKRNPDGSFAVMSGKGHGKRKQAERDWTTATKAELLAEAKRRYPVGCKVNCLRGYGKNVEITHSEYPEFNNGVWIYGNIDGYNICVFDNNHQWAPIIQS